MHDTPTHRPRGPSGLRRGSVPAPRDPADQGDSRADPRSASRQRRNPGGVSVCGRSSWLCVELRAERLDWLPAVIASLDRPVIIERPDDLRGLVIALADWLATSARRLAPSGSA